MPATCPIGLSPVMTINCSEGYSDRPVEVQADDC